LTSSKSSIANLEIRLSTNPYTSVVARNIGVSIEGGSMLEGFELDRGYYEIGKQRILEAQRQGRICFNKQGE
jgi:hypothetical protein